jgi:hypothetical protein
VRLRERRALLVTVTIVAAARARVTDHHARRVLAANSRRPAEQLAIRAKNATSATLEGRVRRRGLTVRSHQSEVHVRPEAVRVLPPHQDGRVKGPPTARNETPALIVRRRDVLTHATTNRAGSATTVTVTPEALDPVPLGVRVRHAQHVARRVAARVVRVRVRPDTRARLVR